MKNFTNERVNRDNKSLYHIQDPTCEWTDEPIDLFIFSTNEPTQERIKQELMYQMGYDETDSQLIQSIVENCNIYMVYATDEL